MTLSDDAPLVELCAEPTDPRLGRHRVHDPRSRGFALPPAALPTRTVLHERAIPIFDQGQLGSCTANAALGMISTGPLNSGRVFTEADAVSLYSEETRIDDRVIPGRYPPDDTGSAGIYSCKAMRARGYIRAYRHAFSLATTLGWLGRQPVSIGIPWLESMFYTNRTTGLVAVARRSRLAGGHQVCLDGIDPHAQLVRFANSWGPGWGRGGWGWLSFDDLGWLLGQGGDAVTVELT